MRYKVRSIILSMFVLSSSIGVSYAGAQTGFVLGAKAGYTFVGGPLNTVKNYTDNLVKGSVNTGGFSGGLILGYDFAFTGIMSAGLEVDPSYINISSVTVASESTDIKMFSLPFLATLKIYLPITGLNIFAKAGFAYNSPVVSSGVWSLSSGSVISPVAAAGIGWQILGFNLFAEYQYQYVNTTALLSGGKFSTNNVGSTNLSIFSAGVTYTLPI